MLFCTGMPGAGKTVLASISVDYLKSRFTDENNAVVCVFCSYLDGGQQRSIDLVASILEQLVQRKGVENELRMLYQLHQPYYTRPKPREISELLFSTIQEFARVFIVIDALDECPHTERDGFIAEICRLRSVANLLITSRNDILIEGKFQGATHLKVHASDTDLENYIRSKTQQHQTLARYVKEDPSLQDEIVAKIIGNARGM